MADKYDPKTVAHILGGRWNCSSISAISNDKHHSFMVDQIEQTVKIFQHISDNVTHRTWAEIQIGEQIMARMHEKLREKGYKTI